MSVDCSHGAYGVPTVATYDSGSGCPECCQLRIEELLIRIADALEAMEERESRDSALARWAAGQGRHPDD